MYLNFSNFRGQTSAGVGDKPWSKTGTSVGWGIDKTFARWGTPIPQEKNPVVWGLLGGGNGRESWGLNVFIYLFIYYLFIYLFIYLFNSLNLFVYLLRFKIPKPIIWGHDVNNLKQYCNSYMLLM